MLNIRSILIVAKVRQWLRVIAADGGRNPRFLDLVKKKMGQTVCSVLGRAELYSKQLT